MTFAKLKNKIPFFKLWNGLRYIKHPWEKYILITIKERGLSTFLALFQIEYPNQAQHCLITMKFSNKIKGINSKN